MIFILEWEGVESPLLEVFEKKTKINYLIVENTISQAGISVLRGMVKGVVLGVLEG